MDRERQGDLLLLAFSLVAQMLASARDGVALLVKQLFDANDVFDIAPPIHALPRTALDWLELGKFRLPEAQYVSRESAEPRHFPNPEVELFWNVRLRSALGLH